MAGLPRTAPQESSRNRSFFWRGHDHLFARQEFDGVVYQELPNPADDSYSAFNEGRYITGDTFPNTGYMKVTVGPSSVLVEYIRMFLAADELELALRSFDAGDAPARHLSCAVCAFH